MPENALAQDILDEIKRLATRFERVEGRLSALEGGMSALDGRMSTLDGRMSALEGGMSTLDSRFEDRMSALDGRISTVDIHMSALERRMTNIETVVAELDVRIKTWPDMHFLAAAAKAQLIHSREIKADVVDIRIRVGEIYQAMATDPEIKSLREEVSGFRDRSLETEIRIGTIEGHIGIKSSFEPH